MCSLQCPRAMKFNEKKKCIPCHGAICPKICDTRNAEGVFIANLQEAPNKLSHWYGCTKIVGNLDIQLGMHKNFWKIL